MQNPGNTENCITRPTYSAVVCGPLGFNCKDNDTYQLCFQPDEDGQTEAPEEEHRCPDTTKCDEDNPVFCTPIDLDFTTQSPMCKDRFDSKNVFNRIRKEGYNTTVNTNINNTEDLRNNNTVDKKLDINTLKNNNKTGVVLINGKEQIGVANLDNSTRVQSDTEGTPEEVQNSEDEPHDVDDNDALENDLHDANCTAEINHESLMPKEKNETGVGYNTSTTTAITLGNKTKNATELHDSWQLDENCSVVWKNSSNTSVVESTLANKSALKNYTKRQIPLTTVECLRTPDVITNNFECSLAGYFPDPSNFSCYYKCDVNKNGEGLRAFHKKCPHERVFDKVLKTCVFPGSTRNTRSTRDFHFRIYRIGPNLKDTTNMNCPSRGKHPDINDCALFYLCRIKRDGSLSETHIKCPEGTAFDPYRKICTKIARYRCIDRLNSIRIRRDDLYKKNDEDRFTNENEEIYHKFKRKLRKRDNWQSLNNKNSEYVEYSERNVSPNSYNNVGEDIWNKRNDILYSKDDSESLDLKLDENYQKSGRSYQKRANLLVNNSELSENKIMPNIINSFKEKNIFGTNSYLHTVPKDVIDLQNKNLGDAKSERRFVCSSDGRYPDPRDSHSYYLCFTNTLDGSFTEIGMKCPQEYVFNADFQGCVHKKAENVDTGFEPNLISSVT